MPTPNPSPGTPLAIDPRKPLPRLTDVFTLAGQTAIVTGAGRGMGAAIARIFAQAGAQVVLAARTEDELNVIADQIQKDGRAAHVVPTDMADEAGVQQLVAATVERFGGVDIVVNNAGWNRFLLPTDQIRLSGLDKVWAINFRGPYVLCQAAGQRMIEQGRGGSIVNVLSTVARQGLATHGPYSAAKAALMRFSEAAAFEWGPYGIRVNCIGPGAVQTEMSRNAWAEEGRLEQIEKVIPVGRIGQPEDIGYAALYLASPASGYITAQTIWVDGGR